MPRKNALRFDFQGPWLGLDDGSADEAVHPGALRSMSNMEMRSGRLRSRRGSAVLTADAFPTVHADHTVRSMYPMTFPNPTTLFDTDLIVQGIGSGNNIVFWRYIQTTDEWSASIGGEWDMTAALKNRATYAQVGDWLYIALGAQTAVTAATPNHGPGRLWAYRRTQLSADRGADVLRRAGFPNWGQGAPQVIVEPSTSGSLGGSRTYSYKVTYYDSNTGLESDLSPTTLTATLTALQNRVIINVNNTGTVAAPVIGSTWPRRYYNAASGLKTDIIATAIRIYRLDPGLNNYHYVTEIAWHDANNAIQTFNDDVSDLSTAQVHLGRRAAPPTTLTFIAFHEDRLWAVPMDSNELWWSEPTEQDTGDAGVEYWPVDNYIKFPEGHRITGIQSFGNQLLVFQQDAVWTVEATPAGSGTIISPTIRKLPAVPGCVSHYTIAQTTEPSGQRRLFWLGQAGVYAYNGVDAVKISTPIETTMPLLAVSPDRNGTIAASAYYASGIFDPWQDRYMLACSHSSDAAALLTVLLFDTASGGWMKWLMGAAAAFSVYSMGLWRDAASSKVVVLMGLANKVVVISSPEALYFTDHGTAIPYSGQTGFLDGGARTAKKKLIEVVSHWMAASGAVGATVTLDVFLDRSGTAAKSETFTMAAGLNKVSTHVGAYGYTASLKWSGNTPAAACDLVGYSFLWEPRGFRR